MNFKKCIFAIVMFGFLSSYGLCLPQKCCKTEFQRNVEEIVRRYLRGQLNRKLIEKIYGDKLKEIPLENKNCNYLLYDIGCYEIEIHYSDSIAKNDDAIPESFWLFAKDGDNEALPLSVFFDLCGQEEGAELRTKIPIASFIYSEVDSTFRISILVKAIYNVTEKIKLRKGSGRMIELTRYPKSWDEVK